MEVINLDLEKNDHKTLNVSSDSMPSSGNLNVVRNDSDIGLDLLMNKKKRLSHDMASVSSNHSKVISDTDSDTSSDDNFNLNNQESNFNSNLNSLNANNTDTEESVHNDNNNEIRNIQTMSPSINQNSNTMDNNYQSFKEEVQKINQKIQEYL